LTSIRFPIRLHSLACFLTIVAFAWFSWIIFNLGREEKVFTERLSRIERLRGVIIHLDEVLTMSARMAATTGDARWEERYRHFEPQLDGAIKETVSIGAGASDIKAAAKTDAANINLVEMENRAFALVRAGRKDEAQTLLFSPEYEAQKNIYAEGIATFVDQIRGEVDRSLRKEQRIDLLSIIAALGVAGTSLLAWGSAARGVRRWRAQLSDSLGRRAQAEENLRKAGQEVEARVNERTAELAAAVQTLQAEIGGRKRREEQLRVQATALDAAANAIVITDHEGTMQSVNPAFTALTGYTAQEAVGQNMRILESGKQDEALYRNLWQTISSGRVWSGEVTNRRKDGNLYSEAMTITPLRNADGVIGRYIAIKQDITERKRAEETLRASQQIIEGIINSIPARVFWKDKNLVYMGCNTVFARDAGFADPKDIIGKDDYQMGWRDQAEKYRRDDREVIESGCSKLLIEEPQTTPEGKTITLLSSKIPLRGSKGEISGMIGTYLDITARKQTEVALQERARLAVLEAQVGTALTQGGTLAEMLRLCCEAVVGQSDAAFARIWTLNEREQMLELKASAGLYTDLNGPHGRVPVGQFKIGLIAKERKPHLTNQVAGDPRIGHPEWAKREGMVAFAGYPLLVEDRLIGVVAMFARHALTETTLQTLAMISKNLAVGIERKRAEQALVSEQRLLNNLITALPDTIYFKDRESRFIRINNGFVRKHGLADASAALGKTDFELFGNEHAGEAYADEQRIITTGQPIIDKEEREDWKDGRVTWVSTTKMPLRDGDGKIVGIMGVSRDITERKRSEESLRLLGSSVEQTEDSIHITDAQLDRPGPRLLFVNPAFTKMTGYTAQEVLGKTPRILQGERTDKAVLARLRAALSRGEAFHGEVVNYRKDGLEFLAEIHIAPIRDANGVLTHFVAIKRDITERRRFEERLFQSQKMETVGKLAGGIAHEFNSIMTAILGQSELMLYDLAEGNPLRKSVGEIHRAADRAAILTRQLLAYGRKQILKPDVLDLNTVLAGMENTLRHLAGRDVDVHIAPPTGPKLVKADAGQIEQVIVNIVMNAADAMPHGGKLTIETADVFLDQDYVSRFPDLKTGDYAMLAITDTGAGMSDAVKARIFEPFFTTKEVGKGTGLGLATCHGIIKQSDGHINVYSEPGRGATFKIYLPKVQLEAKPPGPPLKTPGLAHGTETILLVEDDPALREMAATLLGRLGYTVLTAGNGLEALNVTHQRSTGHIDLLFTDVVMPHMSGKELADRVKALYPRTKILFTSAYTENAFVHQGVLDPGITLLQKPFTPSSLAGKVREVLDRDTTAAAV